MPRPGLSIPNLDIHLKQARKAKGWTQQQLADRSGLFRAQIANYETGVHEPSLPVCAILAQTLSTTVDSLIHPQQPPSDMEEDR